MLGPEPSRNVHISLCNPHQAAALDLRATRRGSFYFGFYFYFFFGFTNPSHARVRTMT